MFTEFHIDSHVRIKKDDQNSILIVIWVGRLTKTTVEDGCMKILEAFKTATSFKILNDHRHVIGDWSEGAEWVKTTWLPIMDDAGLSKLACVKGSLDIPNACFHQALIAENQKNLKLRIFSNYDNAYNWLLEGNS